MTYIINIIFVLQVLNMEMSHYLSFEYSSEYWMTTDLKFSFHSVDILEWKFLAVLDEAGFELCTNLFVKSQKTDK